METTNKIARILLTDPSGPNPTLRRVLGALWTRDGSPRVDLAQTLGLDKSTITKVAGQLIEAGLVEEGAAGAAGPQGGRKPVALRVRSDIGRFLGIEIQTERYTACLADPLGNIVDTHSGELAFRGRSLRSVFLDVLAELRPRIEASGAPLLGIGLGLSGIIDSEKGIVRKSAPLMIKEPVDVAGAMSDLLSVPVRAENDARCCCWSEIVRRRADPLGDFLFLLGEFRKEETEDPNRGGVAVGMGLVLNSQVHRGVDGTSGEFRSIFHEEDTKSQFSLPHKITRRAQEDPAAFEAVARELGRNIGLIVNMLDLRRIVVGGAFATRYDTIAGILTEEVQKNSAYPGEARCEVQKSPLGEEVVAYGAACMQIARMFAPPQA
jgi:predicted NBD/HSP70 family sugar kinase